MKLTKEVLEECYKIINKADNRLTWKSIGEKFNCNGESIRQSFKTYRKRHGELPSIDEKVLEKYGVVNTNKKQYKETIETKSDGTIISDKKVEITDEIKLADEEYMLKQHGYDPSTWKVINSKHSLWDTQIKGGEIKKLYSSKITVQPREDFNITVDKAAEIFEVLNKMPKAKIKFEKKFNQEYLGENLMLVRIADFHYNLKSDLLTTGNEYDTKIAENYFYKVISEVLNRVNEYNKLGKKIERILFTIGDDFINADNIQKTTTAGTPQDCDVSWEKACLGATKLLKDAIEILADSVPYLDIINIQSNHDQHSMFLITEILKARYNGFSNITITNSPLPNQFYVYGKNLMCLAHDMPIRKALDIISDEARESWSYCDNVMCFLAHLHQAMQYEKIGRVEVIRHPTISGWSRWAKSKQFVQSEKRVDLYVINKFKGIIDKNVISFFT